MMVSIAIPTPMAMTTMHEDMHERTEQQDQVRQCCNHMSAMLEQQKIDDRSDQLLAMLTAGPCSLSELVSQGVLYDREKAPPWAPAAERYTIVQHIEELVNQGIVLAEGGEVFALA